MLKQIAVLPSSRMGLRPRMHHVLPHLQLDQQPADETVRELLERSLAIPHVRAQQSRMATPGTQALYLTDEFAAGPPEAFIDGNEFCHIHPAPEGSIHLTLPRILRDEVVYLGWAERHPVAEAGILPALVTVYAPRDRQELETVLDLVMQSCRFAQGELGVLDAREDDFLEDC
jgi:hypothetical protein